MAERWIVTAVWADGTTGQNAYKKRENAEARANAIRANARKLGQIGTVYVTRDGAK
jgi:hypothetical protein